MPVRSRHGLALVLAAGLVLTALALWRGRSVDENASVQRAITPVVMGTTTRIIAVGPSGRVDSALQAARNELEEVNRFASTYDSTSELSRFNRAGPGVDLPLSPALLSVLRTAVDFSRRTGGAFDVTMRPLGLVWAEAARDGVEPDTSVLLRTLDRVGFDKLTLGDSTARKEVPGLEITLDGIVKGFAVDRALEALRGGGMKAGLVEVGGDLACFGQPLDAPAWEVGVQDPFADRTVGVLALPGREVASLAVCTSGNYRRYVTIGGTRHSHIIDPRSGRPADAVPSVTVIAADAMQADAWATALSVLVPEEGARLVEAAEGVEVLWILQGRLGAQLHPSSGFDRFWSAGPR